MPTQKNRLEETSEAADLAPQRCGFYQAAMQSPAASRKFVSKIAVEAKTLSHRCLLNPGKNNGPDGNGIGVSECTLARQSLCQAQRRAAFARLHATMPSVRVAPAAQAATG